MKEKEESIFHIKVDYDEAVQAKKDLLSSERDFLKVLKDIREYNILRKEELNNKLRMQNRIRELKGNLTRINNILPKIKVPDLLKKKDIPKKEEVEEEKPKKLQLKIKEDEESDDLERELKDIQERLSKLG